MLIARRVAAALLVLAVLGSPRAALAQEGPNQRYQEQFKRGLELLEERKYDESIAAFGKAIEIDPKLPESHYNIACAYALRGEKDRALEWLARSLDLGFNDETHIREDKDLASLHADKRFDELLKKAFSKMPPEQALVTLKGEAASLEKLKGKVVVLDFWRTWCGPCRQEIPILKALLEEYGPRGLVVVGVSNEPVAVEEQTADELKINYTLLRQQGSLPVPFQNIHAFPTTFILDAEGRVRQRLIGAHTMAELEAVIAPLLAPAPVPAPAAPQPAPAGKGEKGEPKEF